MPDHIHLFVSAPPRCSSAQLVNLFKGISSRRLRQEFPSLHGYPNRKHLWTASAGTIRHYIESQKEACQA